MPIEILNAAEENFSCTICKQCSPKSSIICCQSCCSIVGCEECVNRWYGSGEAALNKTSSVMWQKGESQNGGNYNTKHAKIWRALYSCYLRFEIRPFAIVSTTWSKCRQ